MRSSLARELSSCCCKRADSSARLVACWLERAEASRSAATLAFNRSSRSATCLWAWAKAAVSPSEILLDQSYLTSELAGIPLGKPGALSIESGSSLGLLMLGP